MSADSDDRPDHDPEVGDWYYYTGAGEICCLLQISSWSSTVDEEAGHIAELLFEDGVLWDTPVSALRDDSSWLPLDRPDDPISPSVMDEVLEAVEEGDEIETSIWEFSKEVDLGDGWFDADELEALEDPYLLQGSDGSDSSDGSDGSDRSEGSDVF
jgi:hypothetical protein